MACATHLWKNDRWNMTIASSNYTEWALPRSPRLRYHRSHTQLKSEETCGWSKIKKTECLMAGTMDIFEFCRDYSLVMRYKSKDFCNHC